MPIPKIVHQTWKTHTVPDHWQESHLGWKTLCDENDWTYMLWTDEDNESLIATHYSWFLDRYKAYKHNIQRADAVRYFILHKYGGLYVDLDIAPIAKRFLLLFELVKDEQVVLTECTFGNSSKTQKLTNSFMASVPESDFWPIVWSFLYKPHKRYRWKRLLIRWTYYFKILMSTGPGIISDAAREYGKAYIIPFQYILPSKSDTNEACVKTLSGGSWHGKDTGFFHAMKPLMTYWQYVLMLILLVLFLVFLSLYLVQKKKCATSATAIVAVVSGNAV
jgi:mannosyltransferase OCH1-like enzyme